MVIPDAALLYTLHGVSAWICLIPSLQLGFLQSLDRTVRRVHANTLAQTGKSSLGDLYFLDLDSIPWPKLARHVYYYSSTGWLAASLEPTALDALQKQPEPELVG
jgi:hypothetical protein